MKSKTQPDIYTVRHQEGPGLIHDNLGTYLKDIEIEAGKYGRIRRWLLSILDRRTKVDA